MKKINDKEPDTSEMEHLNTKGVPRDRFGGKSVPRWKQKNIANQGTTDATTAASSTCMGSY